MVEWLRFGSLIGAFVVIYSDFERAFDAIMSLGFRIRAAQPGRSMEEEEEYSATGGREEPQSHRTRRRLRGTGAALWNLEASLVPFAGPVARTRRKSSSWQTIRKPWWHSPYAS